jgi:hypothetical protein
MAATRFGLFTNTLEVKNIGSLRKRNPLSNADGFGLRLFVLMSVASVEVQRGGVQVHTFGADSEVPGSSKGHVDEDLAGVGLKELVQNPPQSVIVEVLRPNARGDEMLGCLANEKLLEKVERGGNESQAV